FWPLEVAVDLAMPDADPLDDLGLRTCPNCLESMQPTGPAPEPLIADATAVEGSA
ncbi:MAG: hypothetical protein QOC59_859, partial [Microbacteriaceae bacterium]|nr:hypothetical protein [Microbacteriaceae bacterium]